MNFSRNKVWIIPLLALATSPLWKPPVAKFFAPRESKIVFDKKKTTEDDRNLHLYGVTMSQNTGDKLEMVLKAKSVATGGKGKEEFFFQEVDCELYNDEGKPTSVKGGEALLATDKKLITIIDDVVVVAGDGKYQIKTDALRYFTSYKVAKTATPVNFKSNGTVVCGNSMMYNLRTGAFRVGGGVTCEM